MIQPSYCYIAAKGKYISISDSTTQKLLDESKLIYWIISVFMNVFILFVDDQRITLDEIYMEFS